MVRYFLVPVLSLATLYPITASAHEFWIEPIKHILTTGETLEANLKVGQDYSGEIFPLLPSRYERFSVSGPTGRQEITGTIGDIPALRLPDLPDGLHVLAYESTTDRLTFDDWELFTTYVAYEGNDTAIAAHLAAGLPETGFTEGYRRYAKALVQVGPARDTDADIVTGLQIELVALASPYALSADQVSLPVQLLWQGIPLAAQRINVFHHDGETTLSTVTTDADGRAVVKLDRPGRYLLNAVQMELNETDEKIAWDSYWASLTFTRPPAE